MYMCVYICILVAFGRVRINEGLAQTLGSFRVLIWARCGFEEADCTLSWHCNPA